MVGMASDQVIELPAVGNPNGRAKKGPVVAQSKTIVPKQIKKESPESSGQMINEERPRRAASANLDSDRYIRRDKVATKHDPRNHSMSHFDNHIFFLKSSTVSNLVGLRNKRALSKQAANYLRACLDYLAAETMMISLAHSENDRITPDSMLKALGEDQELADVFPRGVLVTMGITSNDSKILKCYPLE